MCSSYSVRVDTLSLRSHFDIRLETSEESLFQGNRIFPYTMAPVVRLQEKELVLSALQFSLLPAWAKEKRVKFSTHNARLEDYDEAKQETIWIHQKPTWREAFRKRHCLVPISEFFEPIRRGEYANHMVRFFPSDPGVLWAAGIWEQWVSKQDGEIIESFAILTDEPIPFVQKTGHDRSPLFLQADSARKWLESTHATPESKVKFLREYRLIPDLSVEKDRPLKTK